MTLEIATQGDIDQIVVSSLSRAFVQKIYRHCWGKNNTPYFAGNCFKGVLYFDERLAIKYAEDVGFPWRGWLSAPKFHHRTGASLHGLSLTVRAAAGQRETSALGLAVAEERPRLDGFLEGLGDDEVLAVLGAVDKGEMLFTLADFDGAFDADKLVIEVERFSDLYCEEAVVTGMRYDGRVMSMETGESRGKSMVDPLLIGRDGKLLDMYDFA
ncbi:MAG: hypothetical protein B193_3271 [Solidesulfovibrio magneticus str. Maddingley MBC34]|uniref:Uncharacterized protein n=1 Tax=Solidesulfovibrio magneticus str. Maddingley MBC34 TaxID=1206767 RepID=K6GAD5_9BACT|nr:MAG: hypothetical protein B193_3271 [Solidesulfovibrio magneticus str. Maddingley MBC34]